ncbi:MAG TPA: ribonuclease HI family protein [Candidatus Paceibacterota bacterium]|nr:ribonuclease HI family protein [Candidatus Paceibacterota bacterium]
MFKYTTPIIKKVGKLTIYTDGGARGNPGPAAIGVLVEDPSASSGRVKSYSEAIGNTTNNVAEYRAVIFALTKAKALLGADKAKETELEIRSDSELVVSQLKGEYKIKDKDLQPLFVEVWNKMQNFKKVEFVLIPREKNKEADALVNRALDTLF